jgi:antitoxin (DNA-binding transcriptional repressor) of toxin-antitoxin stability system
MKTAAVRDLQTDFSRLSKWLEKGETVQLLKRGKPFARVVPEPKTGSFLGRGRGAAILHGVFDEPLNVEPKTKSFLGCMAGTAKVPRDMDEPVGIEWEAMKIQPSKNGLLLRPRRKARAGCSEAFRRSRLQPDNLAPFRELPNNFDSKDWQW